MKTSKELRKRIESEIVETLAGLFKKHHTGFSKDISRAINEHAGKLSRKFSKSIKAKEKAEKKAAKKENSIKTVSPPLSRKPATRKKVTRRSKPAGKISVKPVVNKSGGRKVRNGATAIAVK